MQESTMKLKVLISPEPVGGYSASVPALPGCYSQGDTRQDALDNIREAAELWLEVTSDTAVAQARSASTTAELQEIEL